MTRLTIDENIHKTLLNLTGPAELYDAKGHVLGLVTPVGPGFDDAPSFPITRGELERRKSLENNET